MPLRRATVPWLLVLAASAAATGCGGDATDRTAPDGVVRVSVREFRVDPQDWEVPAGRVRLVVRNNGRLAHNLAIEAVPRASDTETKRYARTPSAMPGATVAVTTRLKPGTYRLACTLQNHDNLGQYGTLRVVAR